MFEARYCAADDDDFESAGFDERPVEIGSEIVQYDSDEEEDRAGHGLRLNERSPTPAPVALPAPEQLLRKPAAKATSAASAGPVKKVVDNADAKKASAKQAPANSVKQATTKKTSGKTPANKPKPT